MTLRQTEPPNIAAAKAGLALPARIAMPRGRRRQDPLAAVWDSEVVPLLKSTPGLRAVAVFDEIRRRHPEIAAGLPHFGAAHSHLAGAQRRRAGRHLSAGAPAGPARAVGFTDMRDRGVSIAGVALDHRLYHFRLAFSGWEHAHVVLGGESFVALAEGLQNALWALARPTAAPQRQSVGRPFRNLDADTRQDQTRRYEVLCYNQNAQPFEWTKQVVRARHPRPKYVDLCK